MNSLNVNKYFNAVTDMNFHFSETELLSYVLRVILNLILPVLLCTCRKNYEGRATEMTKKIMLEPRNRKY